MKRILGGLLAIILNAVMATAQSGKIEEEVLKVDQQWQEAVLKGDIATLESIYSDRLTYIHSDSTTDTKATYVAKLKSGAGKYLSIKRDDIKVSVFGEAAIVSCHWVVDSIGDGKKYHSDGRYMHVYVKQNGKWQMVAHQSTPVSSEG